MTNHKSFCPVPWNFQAIQNNGTVRVCCQMNVTKGRGTLKKKDGTPYNAKFDDLTEARNSTLIKDVRKKMLNNEWPEDCARCMKEEESGIRSRRQWENELWTNITPTTVSDFTLPDGEIMTDELPVVFYDLRFGNFCNLACRMCGPEDSHTWYKDWVEIGHGSKWADTHGNVELTKNSNGRWVTDAYEWHDSQIFWDQIEKNLHNIQRVYMAGGEPLLIERHYEFLQKCIDVGVAKNIELDYNTNLTNLQTRVIDMWKEFKTVVIGASIDGFGDVLEYQRYPAKWSIINKNLKIVDKLPSNVIATISATVTVSNVWQFPDFMLWKLRQGFTKINKSNGTNPVLNYHMCHRPLSNNIQVLPDKHKNMLKEHYESKKKEFDEFDDNVKKSAYKILDGIIKFAFADKTDNIKLEQFIQFTKKLDKVRNQDITSIVPQYMDIFNGKSKEGN